MPGIQTPYTAVEKLMNKFSSIRTKLITNIMLLVSITLVVLLTVITVSNIFSVNKFVAKSKSSVHATLTAKGKTLVKNNSKALSGLAADNAFTAIQNLVASTVADDNDLIYGIYMDAQRVPWVFASPDNPTGFPESNKPLDDSLSLWAGSLDKVSFSEYSLKKTNVIEFAAPVRENDEIIGCIRYGLSTRPLEEAISIILADGRTSRQITIAILFAMGILSLIIGYIIVLHLANRITQPIGTLVNSTKIIAEGNYDVSVSSESNDEIGDLAAHFEGMRTTIKMYTDHLQNMIDEKIQQITDILNNIDQGLFTINLDGSVNHEYSSRANAILGVPDVASCTLKELLRLDEKKEKAFTTWFLLVQKQYTKQRWKKIERLAPVREIKLPAGPGSENVRYISISYQLICNKGGKLEKIMVLAQDISEKRTADMRIAEERLQHENDVKTILCIVNTPAEEIKEFTEDTDSRLKNLHLEIDRHLIGVQKQRSRFSKDNYRYRITDENIERLFRDIHTIKGNSGSYGFELISKFAHETETLIDKLREPAEERRDIILLSIRENLDEMNTMLDDIYSRIRQIYGGEEEVTLHIPKPHINSIVELSNRINPAEQDALVRQLISECQVLTWKPLRSLLGKYQKMAKKLARKLNKVITFKMVNDQTLYPHDTLAGLDEVLIHLIRNAVDHGIENSELRRELGKSDGTITISLDCTDRERTVTISDDGHGIDIDTYLEKCIAKGIISRQETATLSQEEKYALLYKGGISTSSTVSDVSGRGIGMQIIHAKITGELHGTLNIHSTLGKGTTFTITTPLNRGSSHAAS